MSGIVAALAAPLRALLGQFDEARAEGRLALDQVDADFVAETQAAGFRQRREGLAYRLTWARRGEQPVKRVAPDATGLTPRRRAVYRTRAAISAGSHRMADIARRVGRPGIYVRWAWAAYRLYEGLVYARGRFGPVLDRLERLLPRGRRA